MSRTVGSSVVGLCGDNHADCATDDGDDGSHDESDGSDKALLS